MSPDYLHHEYTARINRVIDYIERHLDEELKLGKLAQVASFSPFHFHRIFAAMMGETLNQFISRLRLAKARAMLLQNPKKTITEIAFDCGYSSSATFARAFKEAHGLSASDFRTGKSKIRQMDSNYHQMISKYRKAFHISSMYIDPTTHQQTWRITMQHNTDIKLKADVRIETLPAMNVAYVRHFGPYAGDEQLFERLWGKLCTWAAARDLMGGEDARFMSVYYDDPDLTEESKLRVDVCMTVPEGTQVEGQVGNMRLPGGKYAMAKFEIDATQFRDAWAAVYAGWFPDSGYQPDDRPAFELYLNDPKEHPEGKHIVEICAPVKPL
ncbi:AraC family transcriptional regulator [candidate division KSB1 bacterium]|nr:AraC family transcriptional regulator [candidate division KSB1 bacterium]RQW00143.1 MAG: AraC family transcriptional regulator [candidate division KSB1 bacterium]